MLSEIWLILKSTLKKIAHPCLIPKQREDLKNTILQHDPLFILDKNELGLMSGLPGNIKEEDPRPSRGSIYRYPEEIKDIILSVLSDMEDRDIIERSTSAWLSPILLVNKPDGSKRMCLDYQDVNKHITTYIYPLPRLDELVEQVACHKYYATMNKKDAYFQILCDTESR